MPEDPGWLAGVANKTVFDAVNPLVNDKYEAAKTLVADYVAKLDVLLAAIAADAPTVDDVSFTATPVVATGSALTFDESEPSWSE